ncbi:hypothetical protein Tco_0901093, partial [Tanacetum coccineum]
MGIPGLKTLSSFSDENDNKVSITVNSKKNRSSRSEERGIKLLSSRIKSASDE